jgi:uracil-DNA glycosylase
MKILKEIRACSLCNDVLPFSPRPIIQMSHQSQLLLVGQAPGIAAHESGKPWNDASGIRLREWLNLSEEYFYDPRHVAIVPMGFCYPGKGKSGDLPPRPECRARWMDTVLTELHEIKFTILIGSHAAKYFCDTKDFATLINEFSFNNSSMIVLPHPSPRNNIWLAKNQWFEKKCLPAIRKKVFLALAPKV